MPAHRAPTRPQAITTTLAAVLVAVALTLAPAAATQSFAGRPDAATSTAAPAAPSPSDEAQFVSRINSLRASKGLSQLAVHSELTGVARNWTEQMVRDGSISHNPNLGSQVSGNWTKLGENVGVGYDVDGLMQAFKDSPAHYANLVDPEWNYVGVGVVIAPDGKMYTTHNFMAMESSPPPPPPPPPPTTPPPATNPPNTTAPPTNTTEPATTTTTAPAAPRPEPTEERVSAVLQPLRSLERG